ncbi:16S rRNA (guanine(1207)-N(2))-methyltransferase RsmC [Buchnera aphidicola]|uniref:16S rRNA (guanine(1207)-N(2))-methyltransferase RsmC n=1 Tax=Buchnera aphidicola TaxID=9 RepID=UPI0034645A48
MFNLTQSSKLLLKNNSFFKKKKVIFSGNIQDKIASYIETISTKIFTHMYDTYKILSNIKENQVFYSLFPNKKIILEHDSLIYFWPKNKSEANFQLQYLLSIFKKKSHIFIVGENNSGVKSAVLILENWIKLKKIDTAKHSILFYGILHEKTYFKLENYFNNHTLNYLKIKTLPGVFGHKKIDTGSKLLISTFNKEIKGNILDLGTGSGIISMSLADISKKTSLTLTDINLTALLSCKINLLNNKIQGKVYSSDLYSNIDKRFNMIICNPPIHRDLKLSLIITTNMIKESINYLTPRGELRIVTNTFLSYKKILDKTFHKHVILKKNNHFKVYQAKLN